MRIKKRSKRISLSFKLYAFIIATVLMVSVSVSMTVFKMQSDQIDNYYKNVAYDTARTFAAFTDGDFIKQLRMITESDEYQSVRVEAEKADDDTLIQNYLQEKGVWEEYSEARDNIHKYLRTAQAIKYLHIIVPGSEMHLIDSHDSPMYETGLYQEREDNVAEKDVVKDYSETTISRKNAELLCSAYAPVYDSNGELIAQVRCDYSMEGVQTDRRKTLFYTFTTVFELMVIVLGAAAYYVTENIVSPLKTLAKETKKFKPNNHNDYLNAGIISMDLNSNDEISDLYERIQSMQVCIIDYLSSLKVLETEKEKGEELIKEKEETIGKISKEAYQDSLTGVGSKAAYVKKIDELTAQIAGGNKEIAIMMVDLNCLKRINDEFGHKRGDEYLKGSARIICDIYKHSPIYRIGGDEFVIILNSRDYINRHHLIRKLKEKFDETSRQTDIEPWKRYSGAAGMSEYSAKANTIDLMFKAADKAMYEDKREMKGITAAPKVSVSMA